MMATDMDELGVSDNLYCSIRNCTCLCVCVTGLRTGKYSIM